MAATGYGPPARAPNPSLPIYPRALLRYSHGVRTRRLGQSELELPVVTFGAWAIGGWNWGGTDDGRAARAIHRALEVGMTAIDTAPVYGCGHSERVVAAALASSGRRRDEVQILTKAGLRWDDERGPVAFEGAGPEPVDRRWRRRNPVRDQQGDRVRNTHWSARKRG